MILDLLIITISLVVLIISSITDLKDFEVKDVVSFFFILSMLLIFGIKSIIEGGWFYIINASAWGVFFFILGIVLYKFTDMGGGDVKLLIGLAIACSYRPFYLPLQHIPFPLIFLSHMVLIGTVYTFVYRYISKGKYVPYVPAMFLAYVVTIITGRLLF